ncbi:MAG TPA: glutathione transferase GstA [Nevskia sp.]|nr:glutathione transferase GstA [Nevskia sp.]
MKLYYAPGACSLSPHIALRETGLEHSLQKVDLKTKQLDGSGASFGAINPKEYVPALQLDDGQVLTEGPVIVQYIADRKPEAGLAYPAGTIERYRLQEALNFITSELHKAYSPLFSATAAPAWKDGAREHLAKRFRYLSGFLEGREYVMGKQFTVADGYLFTVLNWSNFVKLDMSPWPVLQAYTARVAARPRVQEALRAEGLA